MFGSLKGLCRAWDPTLQTTAQRTALPRSTLLGKAKRTLTVCVCVLELAGQPKRPGVLTLLHPSSPALRLQDCNIGLAIFLLSGQP